MLTKKNIRKTKPSYTYGFIVYGLLFILSPGVNADTPTVYSESSIKNPETVSPNLKKKIAKERGKSVPDNTEAGKAQTETEQSNMQTQKQLSNKLKEVRPIDQPLYAPVIAPTQNTPSSGPSFNNDGARMVPTPPSTQNTTIISPAPGAQTLTPINSESAPMTVPQALPSTPTTPSTIITPPSPALPTPTVIIHQPAP